MKEFIARDIKKPLVVMGGYRIGEGGVIIRSEIKPSEPIGPTPEDIVLLEKHGYEGLKKLSFNGVIDRLSRTSS